MKDMKYYLRFIVLMLCVSFVACSEDDKGTTPVFPELQEIECAVGEEQTLTFDATSDWTLVSSALWCKFMVDGQEAFTCSGTAGKQSVTIRIGDDATELMKSYKAELTLMSGGAKQVIFTVTRPVTGYELHVFNTEQTVEYTAENPFGKSYGEREYLTVSANVDWVVECSEGLVINEPAFGLAGENATVEVSLKSGFTKEAWQGTLIFKNKKNEVLCNLPVNYEGIPADKIEFSTKNPFVAIPFSAEGNKYTMDSEEKDAPMPITVVAKGDKYAHFYVEYSEELNDEGVFECTYTILSEDQGWFWVEDDNAGNLALNLIPNQSIERNGYLFVFPKEKYDAIKDNFEETVLLPEGVADDYYQYVAANIKQAANSKFTTGFDISNESGEALFDNWGEKVVVYPLTDSSTSEELIAKYGTDNAYVLNLSSELSYEPVVAKVKGFPGMSVEPNDSFEGKDTAWPGVVLSTTTLNWTKYDCVKIEGLAADVGMSLEPMTILCMDQEKVYAVLLVERY